MSISQNRYAWPQRLVHWTTALLVAVMIPTGLYMVRRYVVTNNDTVTVTIYEIHKLIGFMMVWLVLLRLLLRHRHGAPPSVSPVPRWQQTGANVVHLLLYALLVVVPVLGWIGASIDGTRSMWGGFSLPEIAPKDEEVGWRILWWHGWAALTLGALAALHVAAAIHHHIIHKDGLLRRML
jgi:cytochrome b561